MTRLLTIALALTASPAFAAKGPFFSLNNTDFVVLLGFILFIGILLYFKVPGLVTKALDERAEGIRKELDEAKSIREEAQALLASFERKQKDVQTQADNIVSRAKEEAAKAAEQGKAEIERSVARRLAGAEEQIASAEAAAVKSVKDEAAMVAVAAARDVIAQNMGQDRGNQLIDDAIHTVDAKLH
ncbi:MAG: F0F1 ATP synthase subunit B [Shimia sp.]